MIMRRYGPEHWLDDSVNAVLIAMVDAMLLDNAGEAICVWCGAPVSGGVCLKCGKEQDE